jgi:two-component system, cell cycle sensor histidine kinase PleC
MKTALIPALEDVRHRASRLDLESDRNDMPDDAALLATASLPLDGDESLLAEAVEDGPASHAQREDADILKEIARQIREGALSARPTQDTASGSKPSASVGATNGEAQQAANGSQMPASYPQRSAFPVLDPDHFAKLAHELKTPLTAIAAAAEIMRDERLGEMGNERYLSYAADIHESATHALDVITSLLSESAKPDAAISPPIALDLNAIVERTVSSVQALAELHGLALAFDAGDSRPNIVANPTAIRQILLNLLTNAIKFTPRGGDVRVATGFIPDGRIFLVVRDTGCGMNGKTHANSAVAVSNGISEPCAHGHGIGLPLVQRLVREMGADIEIDSAPGKGTVVLIAFGGSAHSSA